ncbi:LysR family transcriptional regulator [Spirochaeta lutea]|uniref:LysR family transcriptional regulator n=1 Tax=Spirochaeta lutea TaxID=1480694 RepID=A0A098QVV1_9SPIO|nr:LysR family transcriptional regulator [Spirochaeta lutea]KGE71980.1 LysR family transcriptional regulator [Spirochaeta lutea]
MNTRALKCFIEVYEKKSVAAAAREIYISPQGLSKIIKQLEYDLETELFFRGAQGMEATEAGELLYARARHICYLLDDIKKEISIIGGSKGTLNVVVTYSTSAIVPYEMLHRFSNLNPNLQIKIDEYPDEFAVNDLFQDEADVGIVLGHEGIPNCSYELLVPGRTVIIVGPDHPLASRNEISLDDLKNHQLVVKTMEPGRDSHLVEECKSRGFDPGVLYSTGNLTALRNSCIRTGVAAESVDFVEQAFPSDQVRVLPLKERIPQNIYVISRDRDIQNRAVTLFQTFLRENFRS